MFLKLTPVLVVEEIEPCLPLWVDQLGFAKVAEVPEGEKLGFVMLVGDSIEVMYQTWTSVEADLKRTVMRGIPSTGLFIEVESVDEIIAKLGDYPVLVPRRETFYGMDEIGIREPGGSLVLFASKVQAASLSQP
jgi:hypothetical protein